MTTRKGRSSQYRVYLLRLWVEGGSEAQPAGRWRFSLESPTSHERRGFGQLEDLCRFLRREIERTEQDET